MSDPFPQDPASNDGSDSTSTESPLTPPPIDPDLGGQDPDEEANTTGAADGNVEADTASGGSPER